MSYSRPRRRSAAKIASTSRLRPRETIMELVEDEDTGAQAAQDLIELPGLGQRIARFGLRRLEGREDGVVEIEQAGALARLTRPKPSGLRPWRASPSDPSARSVRRSCSCRWRQGLSPIRPLARKDGGRTKRPSSIAWAVLACGAPIQRAERIKAIRSSAGRSSQGRTLSNRWSPVIGLTTLRQTMGV